MNPDGPGPPLPPGAFEDWLRCARFGCFQCDHDGLLLWANAVFCEMTGCGAGNVAGLRLDSILAVGEASGACANALDAARRGTAWSGECPVYRKDGIARWWHLWMAPEPADSSGRSTTIFLARDVTGERYARQDEEEFNRLARMVYESAQQGIFVCGPDQRLRIWNPVMEQMSGLPEAEAVGRHPLEILPLIREKSVCDLFARALKGEAVSTPDYFFTVPGSGVSGWAQDQYVPLRDKEGEVAGLMGTVQNVTARKQAEECLLAAHDLLSVMVQSAPFAIVSVDLDVRIISWNRKAEEIFGWSAAEVCGQPLPFVPAETREESQKIVNRITSGESIAGVELVRLRKDGSQAPVRLAGTPLRDANSRVSGAMLIYEDLTDFRRLQEQFLQSQKLESVGRLAGGIAHDFNNLLTVINGYSNLLLMQLKGEDRLREPLSLIARAGERAAELTRQLLAFSRRQVIRAKTVNLNEILAEIARMLDRLVGEDIAITTILDPALSRIHADPGLLHQVVLNLAVNAREAMPDGGRLVLETANLVVDETYAATHPDLQTGPYVLLSVTDTGSGIDESTGQHIFEPFFSTKPGEQAAGLGLATVYGIVKQHGGSIWFDSEQAKGTSFKILLPAGSLAAGDESRVPLEPDERRRAWETILVVEDQEDVRRFTAEALREQGYRVLEARDGLDGLRVCQDHPGVIHLLLTDVVMPGLNGRQLAERSKVLRPEMKVLYLSGYPENVIADRGILDSSVDYLPKPFTVEALMSRIEEILPPAPRRQLVVIVDDEPEIRELFSQILTDAGFDTKMAANGREALECVRNEPVDLVICDLVMPEKEGLETIQALRGSHPSLKMIAVSGAFGGGFLRAARLMGASATLAKPVAPETLVGAVKDLLGTD